MDLRRIFLVPAVAVLAPLTAAAQSPAPAKPSVMITVQTSMFVAGSTATADENAALHQKARAMVYKIGAGECALATAAIQGDCRLSRIQVSTRDPDRGAGGLARPGSAAAPDGVGVLGSFTLVITPSP